RAPKESRKATALKSVKSAKLHATKGKAKPMPHAKPAGAKAAPAASSARRAAKTMARSARRVESPAEKVAPRSITAPPTPPAPPPKVISKQFASAVHAYEAAIKLMYAEDYAKAKQKLWDLIENYPDEPEIQASAKARIHACENKLQERARSVFRSADDH